MEHLIGYIVEARGLPHAEAFKTHGNFRRGDGGFVEEVPLGCSRAVAVVKVLARECGVGAELLIGLSVDIVELAEEICEVIYGGMLVRVLPFSIGTEVPEEGPPLSGGLGRGLLQFSLQHLPKAGCLLFEEAFIGLGLLPDELAQLVGWILSGLDIKFMDVLLESTEGLVIPFL